MRVLRTLPLLVAGVLLMGGAAVELAVPTAVSPGATRGADIAIADPCPTFSWSASTGADSYELTVYRVGDDGRDVRPVLIERFLSPALSWTPSLDRCLVAGNRYAWSVRAGHGDAFSEWSESSLFRVVAATGVEGSTEWLSRGIPRVSEDSGAEGAEDDESADAESATDSAQDRALRLPIADTLLSVDGNVAAVSFSGSGSALTNVDAQELDGIDSSDFLQKREIDRELELEALLGDVTNVLTDDETAATAAALRHDAANCAAGEFAAGVSASGAAQGCAVPADAHASPTRNTRLGDLALSSNTTGEGNTASGYKALHSNTEGFYNTATGDRALSSNTGSRNTASGARALTNNTTGHDNSAFGETALSANTDGENNTAIGTGALTNNVGGDENTASGFRTLFLNSTGFGNTASGASALYANTAGYSNSAFGAYALKLTTASKNTAVGRGALFYNTSGMRNTGIGYEALRDNTNAWGNAALGYKALFSNTTGRYNSAVGHKAGFEATTGWNNVFIANEGVAGDANLIKIGTVGTQVKAYVAGIRGVTTGVADAVTVMIDSAGQLGSVSSSRRYKQEVHDMASVSDRLLTLRPVTFRYRREFVDGDRPRQFGLIAEEVAAVLPELVVYNDEGEPETVKYHLLSSLLLNELQKLHARVEELEPLEARLERLEALVSEPRRLAPARRPPP